jgi:ferredoxin
LDEIVDRPNRVIAEGEVDIMARVSIDETACSGHGRCYTVSPDLFGIDEDGMGVASGNPIVASSLEAAQLAVDNCPEGAIRLLGTDDA